MVSRGAAAYGYRARWPGRLLVPGSGMEVAAVRMRIGAAALAIAGLSWAGINGAAAPALAGSGSVRAGAVPCRAWTGEGLPYSAELTSVIAFSPCDVWAAGDSGRQSLVVHWTGSRWTAISSGVVHWDTAGLPVTIGGTSARDIWLATVTSRSAPVVEHWNGVRFTRVAFPWPKGTAGMTITGISALSRGDAWAVGYMARSSTAQSPEPALTAHWNGHAWRIIPSVSPSAGNNFLYAVSARRSGDVWAAGQYFNAVTDGQSTLIEHWNGHAWSWVPSPDAARENELSAISADSATDVWAVGWDDGLPARSLAEHWNGMSWRVVPSPDPGRDGKGRPSAVLTGVAALSPRDVWAVGYYLVRGGQVLPLIEHWNGTSWRQSGTPRTVKIWNFFSAVSAPSRGDVWAAGGTATISGRHQAIAVHIG